MQDLSGQILRHYEVQLLQLDHARQLFRYWQRTPPVGHPRELQVLEDAILEACAGRPLAVKNTGSQLQNVSLPSQWQVGGHPHGGASRACVGAVVDRVL